MRDHPANCRRAGVATLVAVVLAGCTAGSPPGSASPTSSVSTPSGPPASPAPSGATPSDGVSPSPAQSIPPSPSPAVGSAAWTEVARIDGATEQGRVLVGFAGGYLAIVPDDRHGPPEVRHSVDGRSWQTIELPAPYPVISPGPDSVPEWARPTYAATDGTAVVLVGGYAHLPCDWTSDTGGGPRCPLSPISWVTTDGTTWRSSLPLMEACEQSGAKSRQGCAFSAVWSVPDGWETAMAYIQGESAEQREIWHSPDGTVWDHRADLDSTDPVPLVVVGADGHRLLEREEQVCTGDGDCSWPRQLLRSDDGIAWLDAAEPDASARVTDGVGPRRTAGPWILTGLMDCRTRCVPASWTSSDLSAWTERPLPGAAGLDASTVRVVASDAGYALVASGGEGHGSWLSSDGVTWQAVEDAPAVTTIAEGPAGVIGFGAPDEGGVIRVYALR